MKWWAMYPGGYNQPTNDPMATVARGPMMYSYILLKRKSTEQVFQGVFICPTNVPRV